MTHDTDLREAIDERDARRGRRAEENDSRAEADPQADPALFPEDRATALRERWADIQARFVDDPRAAVRDGESLVGEVVGDLTKRFEDERGRLESKWSRDERVDTEELRVAIRRYRAFFERLLKM